MVRWTAENATRGDYALNAQFAAAKGVKVPKGARFVEIKAKFLSEEIEHNKENAVRKR